MSRSLRAGQTLFLATGMYGYGRWHATRTSGQSGLNGEIALRLK
jgi:hypothetical protein